MKDKWLALQEIIDDSKNIVFFGGAGVSTESDIPDFRSEKGLYQAKRTYGRSPEEMISHSFFLADTETFYDYYKNNMVYPRAEPNKAHLALAQLEREGKLSAVVTQNIDGLHQKAGSRNVFEVHGSVQRNFCMNCGADYDLDFVLDEKNCVGSIPHCNKCDGIVKPDVVLYEEALDDQVIAAAVDAIKNADTLIIGGTSLVVYPAASFVNYFGGDKIVLINKSKAAGHMRVDLEINDPIGEVLGEVVFIPK
ncbi:MAG: NAD-dependent protein deacylase [Anaerovoracaceae bacterium]|jgi:NAD-dependent deacetylase